jgi:hypothetical protein
MQGVSQPREVELPEAHCSDQPRDAAKAVLPVAALRMLPRAQRTAIPAVVGPGADRSVQRDLPH